jgi:hypothetical protein
MHSRNNGTPAFLLCAADTLIGQPLGHICGLLSRNPTVASTGLCARAITELCTEVKLPSGVSRVEFTRG